MSLPLFSTVASVSAMRSLLDLGRGDPQLDINERQLRYSVLHGDRSGQCRNAFVAQAVDLSV
jgi:hypothetical protein